MPIVMCYFAVTLCYKSGIASPRTCQSYPSCPWYLSFQVDVQLKERVGMNVTKVMSRLDQLKPRARNNAHGQPMPVDRAVHDLIAAAQSETNLAKMSPTFLSFV